MKNGGSPFFLACLCLVMTAAACGPQVTAEPPLPGETTPPQAGLRSTTPASTPTPPTTQTQTPRLTPSASEAPSSTPTGTPTLSPSQTPTATLTPTYAILRAKVLVRSNCRYGPGAPYLYKYGLVPGSNLEVIGRTDSGSWILVQAIGGNNPCWVKASLMEVKGEVMTIEPTYIPLPQSPYYGPLRGVSALRSGEEVTISWSRFQLRAGDETASAPYLVEAWVCQNGQLAFIPLGAYETAVKVRDEPGCAEPSHGRVYGVEKHGYTRWVEVPWPAHE